MRQSQDSTANGLQELSLLHQQILGIRATRYSIAQFEAEARIRSLAVRVAVLQMLLFAPTISAQAAQSVVRGKVSTDSGRVMLEGVEVLLEERGVVVRSGASGRYVLQTPDTGVVTLLVRHPGYSPVRDTIRLERSVELERNFQLVAIPTTLAGVEVRERGGVGNVVLRDFERRRKGSGKFMVQAEIERTGAQSFESLVRSHIGGFLTRKDSQQGNGGGRATWERAKS